MPYHRNWKQQNSVGKYQLQTPYHPYHVAFHFFVLKYSNCIKSLNGGILPSIYGLIYFCFSQWVLDTRSHYYKWISSLSPYTHTHTPACTYRTSVGLIKFGCYSKVPVSILIHSFLPQTECLENSRVRYLSYSHGA